MARHRRLCECGFLPQYEEDGRKPRSASDDRGVVGLPDDNIQYDGKRQVIKDYGVNVA
jgi:hypothetical protein